MAERRKAGPGTPRGRLGVSGPIAQLVERMAGSHEVRGSIPLGSTSSKDAAWGYGAATHEVVRAAGYSPIVVVSPADALAIQLLQLTGGDSYAFGQNLRPS